MYIFMKFWAYKNIHRFTQLSINESVLSSVADETRPWASPEMELNDVYFSTGEYVQTVTINSG